jgi:hypothetical protein
MLCHIFYIRTKREMFQSNTMKNFTLYNWDYRTCNHFPHSSCLPTLPLPTSTFVPQLPTIPPCWISTTDRSVGSYLCTDLQTDHRKDMNTTAVTGHRCYEMQWSQHAVPFVDVLLVWWHSSLWCTSIYHLSRWLMCGRGHLGGGNFRKLLFIARIGFKARYNS